MKCQAWIIARPSKRKGKELIKIVGDRYPQLCTVVTKGIVTGTEMRLVHSTAPEGAELCNGSLSVRVSAEKDYDYGGCACSCCAVLQVETICTRCGYKKHGPHAPNEYNIDDMLTEYFSGFKTFYK